LASIQSFRSGRTGNAGKRNAERRTEQRSSRRGAGTQRKANAQNREEKNLSLASLPLPVSVCMQAGLERAHASGREEQLVAQALCFRSLCSPVRFSKQADCHVDAKHTLQAQRCRQATTLHEQRLVLVACAALFASQNRQTATLRRKTRSRAQRRTLQWSKTPRGRHDPTLHGNTSDGCSRAFDTRTAARYNCCSC